MDSFIKTSMPEHKMVRRAYIAGTMELPFKEEELMKHPSERCCSKSPSKKSLISAEIEATIAEKGKLDRGDKTAARRRVEEKLRDTLK